MWINKFRNAYFIFPIPLNCIKSANICFWNMFRKVASAPQFNPGTNVSDSSLLGYNPPLFSQIELHENMRDEIMECLEAPAATKGGLP